MLVNIPFEIGETITINGKQVKVQGVHLFVCKDGKFKSVRVHIGGGVFVTVENYSTIERR